jgi:hypothetical protein
MNEQVTVTSNPWSRHGTPIVGRARSSSSICQSCQRNIPQGGIRVGMIFSHLKGYIALDWHHLTCCQTPEKLPYVEGYDILSAHEKEQIHAYCMTLEQQANETNLFIEWR